MICRYCWNVVFVCLFMFVVILIYHFSINNLTKSKEDVLNRKVFEKNPFGDGCVSFWPITHFLFFFVLGALFPRCWLLIIFIGVLFEIIEEIGCFYLHVNNTPKLNLPKDKYQYCDQWISGSFLDIIADISGMLIGIWFAKYIGRICEKHDECYPCVF